MPSQKPVQTFTPNEVSELTGIAAHNVRRWAEYHAMHLSDGANPPTGMARRFTGRDIEVLRHVDSLRKQGLTVPVINEQLSGLTFAEIDNGVNSEAIDNVTAPTEAPPAAPAQAALQNIQGDVLEHVYAIERRVEALEGPSGHSVKLVEHGVIMFAMGFIAALLLVLLFVGAAVLYLQY